MSQLVSTDILFTIIKCPKLSDDCCSIAFVQDLQYWGVSENSIETCCLKKFSEVKDNLEWTMQGGSVTEDEDMFPPGKVGEFKRKVWDLFEKPHTSIGARIVAVFSVLCDLSSVLCNLLSEIFPAPFLCDLFCEIFSGTWLCRRTRSLHQQWKT